MLLVQIFFSTENTSLSVLYMNVGTAASFMFILELTVKAVERSQK